MARLRLSLGISLLGTALALTGCPSSTTPSNVPIDMLGETYGGVSCDILVDCYGEAVVSVFTGTTGRSACVARAAASYENGALPRYQAAIAMGTLSYDGSQAGACVDAISALGCGALSSRTPAACDALFVGHVALGGACAIDEECEGSAFCSADAACPGTCQTLGASGATCTRDQGCQSGLRCMGPPGGGTCQTPAGAGASCEGSTGIQCAGGFICQGSNGTMAGTCAAIDDVFSAASGQACDLMNNQFCQEGLSCIVTSLTSQTCGAGGVANGGACHLSIPSMCVAGAYCSGTNPGMGDFDGTCAPLPSAGMPCAMVLVGASCAEGAVCESGTCTAIVANGGACMSGSDCYGGNCVGGTCVAPSYCP